MQPAALGQLAGLGAHLDAHAGADQLRLRQRVDEGVECRPHAEGHLVDAVEGGLELDDGVEVPRWGARDDHPAVVAAGDGVRVGADGSEAALHVDGGQCGEVAEPVHAEAAQQHGEPVVDEDADGEVGEEGGRAAGVDEPHPLGAAVACRLLGGERAVGDAHPGIGEAGVGEGRQQRRRRALLAAVVARRTAGPDGRGAGPDELHAREWPARAWRARARTPGHRAVDRRAAR